MMLDDTSMLPGVYLSSDPETSPSVLLADLHQNQDTYTHSNTSLEARRSSIPAAHRDGTRGNLLRSRKAKVRL